jgi:pimeloyl-ACP methyl ester carboxylesterase
MFSMPVKLHYETVGTGPPLVLVMGLGAPGSLWELHVNAYAREFCCIIPDNRGAGDSPQPAGPYSSEMMARDTLALMDDLDIGSARVAGISMGSVIAQSMALLAPERVRSMVLVSSWARCDQYMKDVFESFERLRAVVSPEHFMQLLHLWIFAPEFFDSHYDDLLIGRAEAQYNTMSDHAFSAQCAACINHDTLDRLEEIRTPCLLTVGDADIFTPLRCSRQMHERLPHSELAIFPGLAHCHHWEDLKTFNETTMKFLQEN